MNLSSYFPSAQYCLYKYLSNSGADEKSSLLSMALEGKSKLNGRKTSGLDFSLNVE